MSQSNNIYILSIEAKDLYDANHLNTRSDAGYDIRDKDGEPNYKRFSNSFDYSLDLIKLRDVYYSTYRRRGFSWFRNGKEYSKEVINVTFKYSYKKYNRVSRKIDGQQHVYFVHHGYRFEDLEFNNCLAFCNNILAGVEVDTYIPVPVSDALLGEVFRFDPEEHCYRIVPSKNETLMSRKALREALYLNGFDCDSRHYVRFKRSSGSSRIGKCLFINSDLAGKMRTWEKCGLTVRKGQKIDLAAWEAYISLTTSSIIDTLEIRPENILLIDDYSSTFTDRMLGVGLDGTWLDAKPQEREISNCIWDGQSLLDTSLFGEKYKDRGMLLLRTRFFKSACFNTDIQKFFADQGITDVSQLNGYTRATKVEDIKLITTPSSLKFLKFGSFDLWLNKLEPLFGIVKYDKPSHYFDGRMVQCHYQLLNTLHMSYEDTEKFLAPSYEYYKLLDTDPAVFRYHVKCIRSADTPSMFKVRNDLSYYLLGVNKDFTKTRLFHNWKQDVLKSFKDTLKQGHVLIPGTYATLFGNPYEMLLQSIGRFDGNSVLGEGHVYCSMFEDGTELLGSRSPHVAAGNILLTKNHKCEYIDRYFNLSKYIVCINSIGENILERLSGADMDSDTMLLTSEPLLVSKAKEHYDDFLVPTKLVPVTGKSRKYTPEDKADLDHTTANNLIGEIVNLSQELNSLFWDKLNHGATLEDVMDIYNDIAKLDVLSNIEIDRAKKECVVDSAMEMRRIRQKYSMVDKAGKRIKPHFFAYLARCKGFYDTTRNHYKHHKTTMDYVHEIVCKWRSKSTNLKKLWPVIRVFRLIGYERWIDHEKIQQVFDELLRMETKIQSCWIHWASEEMADRRRYYVNKVIEFTQDTVQYINDLKLNGASINWILRNLEDLDSVALRNGIVRTMLGQRIPKVTQFLKAGEEVVPMLRESEQGPLKLYDINFEYFYDDLQKLTENNTPKEV